MYSLIFFFPFFSAIINGFFGRFIGNIGVCIISVISLGISSIICMVSFYEVVINQSPISIIFTP